MDNIFELILLFGGLAIFSLILYVCVCLAEALYQRIAPKFSELTKKKN